MDKSIQNTTLYRYFDKDDQLLYVGITGDNTKRQSQHRRSSFWFGLIASATFQHFASRDDALEAESRAIQSEKPKHNQMQGFTIRHSAKAHIMFLTGRPSGGHEENHMLFARLMNSGMRMYDGRYRTPEQVLAACMIFADMGKTTRNLQECHNCLQAFTSDWFQKAKAEMTKDGTL